MYLRLSTKVQLDYCFPFVSGFRWDKPIEPSSSLLLPNCTTLWPITNTTPLRKGLVINRWTPTRPRWSPIHCTPAGFLSSLPASSCPQAEFDWRNRMQRCLWVRFDSELCRWGGKVFLSWGGLIPPAPIRRCSAWSNPRKEGGATGPQSVVLARSPVVGECGCSSATGSLPQFGFPGVWEGGLSSRFPCPPPSVARCCCSDTPDLLDSGGSPSLCWTKDMTWRSNHTQAVQPSYNWARLSMLVASLMTTSTCNKTLQLYNTKRNT